MKNLKSILVGIDYSECCESALSEAARIANWNDGKLVCLHVFDEEILEQFKRYEGFDHSAVLDEAKRRLETFVAEKLGAGHDIQCEVRVGHPFKELLHGVSDWNADLLVLGARGLKQKNPTKLGVFAARCVRKAPLPVMVVRRHQADPFERIVACVDFSETSEMAAQHAVEVAELSSKKVELFHGFLSPILAATDEYGFGPALPPVDTAETQRALEQKLDALAAKLGEQSPDVEIITTVREGVSVAKSIIDHLEDCEADLVVLGTRGRTGLKSLLMGTTAEKIVHETSCSALAVKPQGFEYEVD